MDRENANVFRSLWGQDIYIDGLSEYVLDCLRIVIAFEGKGIVILWVDDAGRG